MPKNTSVYQTMILSKSFLEFQAKDLSRRVSLPGPVKRSEKYSRRAESDITLLTHCETFLPPYTFYRDRSVCKGWETCQTESA
jgi:hypothetical protein